MFRAAILIALPLLAIGAPQDAAPPAAPDPVVAIEGEFPNFIRIGDVRPPILAVLRDPDVNAVVAAFVGPGEDPPFVVADELSSGGVIPQLPSVVALGADIGAMETLGGALRVLIAMNIFAGAIDEETGVSAVVPREEIARCIDEMVSIIETRVRRGRLALYLALEQEGGVESILEGLAEGISGVDPAAVESGAEGVRIDAGRLLRNPVLVGQLEGALGFFGAAPETMERLRTWIRDLRAELRAEAVPGGIRFDLTVGPAEETAGEEAKESATRLRALGSYPAAAPPLCYVRWDLTPLIVDMQAGVEFVERWEPTALGRRAATVDAADTLEDIPGMVGSLRAIGSRGVMTLALGPEVRFRQRSEAPPRWLDLRGSALARAVPSDAAAWWLDGTLSIATAVSAAITEAEGNAERKSLGKMLSGEDSASFDGLLEIYYQRSARLKSVLREASGSLPPGWGLFVDEPRSARVSVTGTSAGAIEATEVPFPGGAVLLACEDPLRLRGQVAELARALGAGIDAPVDGPNALAEVDLGLGVKTYRIELPALGGPEVAITVGGEAIEPHLAVFDGVAAISISRRTTGRIRDALAAEGTGRVSGDAAVVSASSDPFPAAARYGRALAAWLEPAAEGAGAVGAEGTGTEAAPAPEIPFLDAALRRRGAEVLRILADAAGRATGYRYRDEVADGVRDRELSFAIGPTARALPAMPRDLTKEIRAAHLAAARWIAKEPRPDGRWSASEVPSNEDVALTARALIVLDPILVVTSRDPSIRAAREKAIEWLLAAQRTEGDAAGHFGDPAVPGALEAHVLVLRALGAEPVFDDSVIPPADAAFAWLERLDPASLSLDDATAVELRDLRSFSTRVIEWDSEDSEDEGADDARRARMGKLARIWSVASAHFEEKPPGERDRVPALAETAPFGLGAGAEAGHIAKLLAECERLAPAAPGPVPWLEVGTLTEAIDMAIFDGADSGSFSAWRNAWIGRLLAARATEGDDAGSWGAGDADGGSVEATARAVELIDDLVESRIRLPRPPRPSDD